MRVQGDQLISITCGAESAVSRSNRTVNQLIDNYIAAVDKQIFFFSLLSINIQNVRLALAVHFLIYGRKLYGRYSVHSESG